MAEIYDKVNFLYFIILNKLFSGKLSFLYHL